MRAEAVREQERLQSIIDAMERELDHRANVIGMQADLIAKLDLRIKAFIRGLS